MLSLAKLYNINTGKTRQPTQDEVNFLHKHLLTLKMGLRDTQARMKETRDRLEMALLKLIALGTDVPSPVFQTWLDRTTSLLVASPAPSGSPKLRNMTAINRRSRSQHRFFIRPAARKVRAVSSTTF